MPRKWLSYREQTLLHRPLTPDEAEHFTHHTRRITALLAENDALDGHYRSSLSTTTTMIFRDHKVKGLLSDISRSRSQPPLTISSNFFCQPSFFFPISVFPFSAVFVKETGFRACLK